ncbi:hypothetical protein GFS60_00583 [Rhodococcus sp. WAY2]|nr:hypothetical protein GFS60_00583 [Rhodococcus sp. WAY2]
MRAARDPPQSVDGPELPQGSTPEPGSGATVATAFGHLGPKDRWD